MAKAILFLLCTLVYLPGWSQTVNSRLTSAFQSFEKDPQLRNGIAALYVLDAKTGKVVYEKNSLIGLAPASTIKVITSASAYELLGKDFRYETQFAYSKSQEGTSLLLLPSGDPTLGSWRWRGTKEAAILRGATQAIKKAGITSFSTVLIDNEGWNEEAVPDGWMWQDIGNYYGAGLGKLNWRENQYDVILKSGKNIGDPVQIASIKPNIKGYKLKSELTSAAAGTGDNAYIYFPLNADPGTIRGTIPINQNSFKISGAMPSAPYQFVHTLLDTLATAGLKAPQKWSVQNVKTATGNYTAFHTITSPSLDSIIYWFNRKSINLYGEALMKTIGFKHKGKGATDTGIDLVQNFWKQKGIPETELNMVDGSGLSPLNRVTTHAQVGVLQHAKKQDWFPGFYTSVPEYNNMKMKSGTIRGVKGFCGYHKAKDGNEYIFSFIVNNYNGSSSALVQKMYKVLDVLK